MWSSWSRSRNAADAPRCSLKDGQLKEFREALLAWFAQFQRDLPWRRTCDPYRIWISEIMLQQTRVAAVIPYYQKFLELFPDVQALAEAPQEEVLRLWSGLGYYSRARNLQKAACRIVAVHGGEFPRTNREVVELAGIGEYTAAAILSIAFGAEFAVLDGNVARVLARIDAQRGDLRQPRRWRLLQERADELLARDAPGDWNQAMMELGATLCTPRSPQCLLCPVQKFCKARQLGMVEDVPEKRQKRAVVSVHLAAAVFVDGQGNSLLLSPPKGLSRSNADDDVPSLVAKLWHFPTTAGDSEARLMNLLSQRFRVKPAQIQEMKALPKVRHTVTYRKVTISPFLVRVRTLPRISGASPVALRDIVERPISNLTRKVARAVLAEMKAQEQ
jgi:A/G-specific adenine glycosylase